MTGAIWNASSYFVLNIFCAQCLLPNHTGRMFPARKRSPSGDARRGAAPRACPVLACERSFPRPSRVSPSPFAPRVWLASVLVDRPGRLRVAAAESPGPGEGGAQVECKLCRRRGGAMRVVDGLSVHEDCAVWAPNVFEKDGELQNVGAEVRRGAKLVRARSWTARTMCDALTWPGPVDAGRG